MPTIKLLQPGDDTLHIEANLLFNDCEMTQERSAALLAADTYLFVVALSETGEIMGRIYAHVLHRLNQTDLLLYEVDVDEAHQRKGIGKAMLEFMKALINERGYAEMWVLTEGDNKPARALYESAGGIEENSPTIMYAFYNPLLKDSKHDI